MERDEFYKELNTLKMYLLDKQDEITVNYDYYHQQILHAVSICENIIVNLELKILELEAEINKLKSKVGE